MAELLRLVLVAAFFVAGFGFGLGAAAWRARRLADHPELRRAVQAHHDRVDALRRAAAENAARTRRATSGERGLH
jgi:hypothetical protein